MNHLYYGPAGWDFEDWKGPVYPRPAPRGFHPLPFLARYVNLIEVNATFYAPARPDAALGWLERLAPYPHVRFLVKAWRRLTHEREPPDPDSLASWRAALDPLMASGRLLGVLLQFPPWVHVSPGAFARLRRIQSDLSVDGDVPLATEFRHPSWIEPDPLEWLADHGFAFVNIDQPQGSGTVPPTSLVTAPWSYVRLHGRNAAAWFRPGAGRDARYDYHYPEDELDAWASRIEALRARTDLTVVVGNNHYDGQAMAAVLGLAHRLLGEPIPIPDTLRSRFPELESRAAPEPGSLFP